MCKGVKRILVSWRINPKREFYYITEEEIKMIYDFFIELNMYLNSEERLFQYIQENDPEYLNKKRYRINNLTDSSSSSEKPNRKKLKGIYVDTSY
jgi:hypothetical protein